MTFEQVIDYLNDLEDDVYIKKTFDVNGHLWWHCWIDCQRGVGVAAPSGTHEDLITAMELTIKAYQSK